MGLKLPDFVVGWKTCCHNPETLEFRQVETVYIAAENALKKGP